MSVKQVVLTGLRVNNGLHVGNYAGALQPIINFAREHAETHQINLFVPDLHSITTSIPYSHIQKTIIQTVKTYIALGLPVEHKNVYVYRQSYVPAHSELTWILSCFTGFGEMRRMTQFKDKKQIIQHGLNDGDETVNSSTLDDKALSDGVTGDNAKSVSVGLFSYPILMAADILLYDALYVPVGDDQSQHLEFSRDIAQRMNKRFGADLFVVPATVDKQHEFFGKAKGVRIKDLQEPTKKMSKSDATGKGVLFIDDDPKDAYQKIMSATTDSNAHIQYNHHESPGITNLLDLLDIFGGDSALYIGESQYGPFKKEISERIVEFIESLASKKQSISDHDVLDVLQQGEVHMNRYAEKKLKQVQHAVGLRPSD